MRQGKNIDTVKTRRYSDHSIGDFSSPTGSKPFGAIPAEWSRNSYQPGDLWSIGRSNAARQAFLMRSVSVKVGWISFLLCAGISWANAAAIKLDGSCSYFGEALPPRAELVSSTDEVGTLIKRIVDASGLSRNFEVRAALVPNAVAMNLGSTRYILYNPKFIQEISTTSGNRWAALGILAHEVGHHLNGHTLASGGSRPPLELQADYFSGFVLQKLGATLVESTDVIERFAPETSSLTHPSRRERVASIAAGWGSACDKDPDCRKDAISREELGNGDAALSTSSNPGLQKKTLIREAQ